MADNSEFHAKGDDATLKPDEANGAGAALDSLFSEITETPPDAAAAAAKKKAEDEAAAAAAATKVADTAPTIDETVASAKADEEAKLASAKADADAKAAAAADPAAAAAAAAAVDPLDAVELPPHTKPKSAEAFGRLKQLAKENAKILKDKIAENDTKLAAVQAELDKAKAIVPGSLTPELQAEMEDLRKFRLSIDATSDPTFKEFDSKIEANVAQIYKKLEASGLSAESVKAIKDLGGPEQVDWEPIMPKLPLTTRRLVESLLVSNEGLKDSKAEALEKAKADAPKYVAERSAREAEELTKVAQGYIKNLPWTSEKAIPAGAKPEEVAAIEESNTFARESLGKLKDFLANRSLPHIAELAVGTLIAYQQRRELNAIKAAQAALNEKLVAITAERDKLAAATAARKLAELPRGGGAAQVIAPVAKVGSLDVRKAGEALDALYEEMKTAQG
jgi:hypothetical protein